MRVSITRDGEFKSNAEVEDLKGVPELAFAASQHYGGGEIVIRCTEPDHEYFAQHEPLYRMNAEWLEAGE